MTTTKFRFRIRETLGKIKRDARGRFVRVTNIKAMMTPYEIRRTE